MGLTTSLSTALTGLRASQQSIAVLSQNIANANNEDYTRQVVSQSTIAGNGQSGNGVRIDDITRVVDQAIDRTVISRRSLVARSSVIDSYYQQSQIIIGQPGRDNSIDTYTQNFFNSLQTLSNDTENSSLKLDAVSASETLANEISNLAFGLETLRFEADKDIERSVNRINASINTLHDLNIAAATADSLGNGSNIIADEMDTELNNLAEEFNITYEYNDRGQVTVNAANGAPLLDTSSRYNLSYQSSSSAQELVDDTPSLAISAFRVDNITGEIIQSSGYELVSGGNKSDVESPLTGGAIQGLLEIRDELIPDILDQLDNFVAVLRDEVNAIYNNGSAFPPETTLNGSTLIDPTDIQSWNGTVLIGAVQVGNSTIDGQPVPSPYASQTTGLKPLTLDFDALTDTTGAAGTFSFQTIIDEINNYYGAPQPAVSIGDLANIELISKSDSLTAGTGVFAFNLETTNLSADNRDFTITGITPSDANISVTSPATFPSAAFTSTAGATELASGTNFSLDFSSGSIPAGPYTIDLDISVDDGAGGFYTDTITYTIAENPDGLINDRFAASAVSGVGDAAIESPALTQPFLTATLVDADGVEVAKDPVTGEYRDAGYLKLEGADGVGVAINELDSTHQGNTRTEATGYGFSHFFGLNNFFETGDGSDPSAIADAAITFRVREDIAATPGKIGVGKLAQSSQSTIDGDAPRYTYEISSGNNDTILDLNNLQNVPIAFPAAGGNSRATVSFNNYAAQILGYTATVSSNASDDLRKEELIFQGFADKQDSIGGVNVDEEIANTITFQNSYAANARVISVIGEMFDTLMSSF